MRSIYHEMNGGSLQQLLYPLINSTIIALSQMDGYLSRSVCLLFPPGFLVVATLMVFSLREWKQVNVEESYTDRVNINGGNVNLA